MKRSDFGRSHSLIRFSQQNEQIIYIAFARNLGGPDIEGVISPNRTTAYLSIPGWEVVTDIACNQSPTSANAIRFDTIDTQIQSNKERLSFFCHDNCELWIDPFTEDGMMIHSCRFSPGIQQGIKNDYL